MDRVIGRRTVCLRHETLGSSLSYVTRVQIMSFYGAKYEGNSTINESYRVRINYRWISLRHNLSRKCRKIVKFVSITPSERNIWNGPIVATAISRKKRKLVLEGNGCLTYRA